MLATRPITDDDLTAKARELAQLLNSLPLPPLQPAEHTPLESCDPVSRPHDHTEAQSPTC